MNGMLILWQGILPAQEDPMTTWKAVSLVFWLALLTALPGAADSGTKSRIEELVQRGLLLEEAHLWRSAIDVNKEVLELDPKNVAAMNTIAGLYGILGEYHQEVTWALKALEVDPRFELAHINHGNGLAGMDQIEEAEAAFRKAAELAPQNPLPVYSLGVLAENQGRVEQALSHYERSVKLDARFENGYFNMAAMLANLGRFDEAIASLETLLKMNPDVDAARQMIAQIQADKERRSRATLSVEALGEGRIRIERGDRKLIVDLAWEISGCTSRLYDRSTGEEHESTVDLQIVDETRKAPYTYLVLMASAPPNCNVQGHCGAGDPDSTLIWLKLTEDLALAGKQASVIDDCKAGRYGVFGEVSEDGLVRVQRRNLPWIGDALEIELKDDTDGPAGRLIYDRRNPDAGLRFVEPRR